MLPPEELLLCVTKGPNLLILLRPHLGLTRHPGDNVTATRGSAN